MCFFAGIDGSWKNRTGRRLDRWGIVIIIFLTILNKLLFLVINTCCLQQILALETRLFLSSLNLYDQHRDMRLDIDNMSYEVELSFFFMMSYFDGWKPCTTCRFCCSRYVIMLRVKSKWFSSLTGIISSGRKDGHSEHSSLRRSIVKVPDEKCIWSNHIRSRIHGIGWWHQMQYLPG